MSTDTEPVDADVVDATVVPEPPAAPQAQAVGTDVVPHYSAGKTELIVGATPAERVAIAVDVATSLNDVIVRTGARTKVGSTKLTHPDGSSEWVDKYHVNVEGWQTLASLLGVALVERYVRPVVDPVTGRTIVRSFTVTERRGQGDKRVESTYDVEGHDWEAVVDAVKDGVIIGTGSGMVSRSEFTWAKRDERSSPRIPPTRATPPAMRQAAAWVVSLAGYSTTPTEEMPPQPADAPAGPFWAEDADEAQIAAMIAAIEPVLGGERAAKFAGGVRATYGDVVPKPVAVSVAAIVNAITAKLTGADAPPPTEEEPPPPAEEAPPPPAEEAPALAPASVLSDTNALDAMSPVEASATLRGLGCTCTNPVSGPHSDACPIIGHGIAF